MTDTHGDSWLYMSKPRTAEQKLAVLREVLENATWDSWPINGVRWLLDAPLLVGVAPTPQPKTLIEAMGLTPEQVAEMEQRLAADFERIRDAERRAASPPDYIIGASESFGVAPTNPPADEATTELN